MARVSAGLLMFRHTSRLEVFLVHPGGPFWAHKNLEAWTIPKGEYSPEEAPLAAAEREFHEETGFRAEPPYLPLGEVRQGSGKVVSAWAFAGDCDPEALVSNTCLVEWPPRSGRHIEVPEVDRGAWFDVANARLHLLKSQVPLLDRLLTILDAQPQR